MKCIVSWIPHESDVSAGGPHCVPVDIDSPLSKTDS